MRKLLRSVYKGMSDTNAEVRNVALFALGEFSEYLQVRFYFLSDLISFLEVWMEAESQLSNEIIRVFYLICSWLA